MSKSGFLVAGSWFLNIYFSFVFLNFFIISVASAVSTLSMVLFFCFSLILVKSFCSVVLLRCLFLVFWSIRCVLLFCLCCFLLWCLVFFWLVLIVGFLCLLVYLMFCMYHEDLVLCIFGIFMMFGLRLSFCLMLIVFLILSIFLFRLLCILLRGICMFGVVHVVFFCYLVVLFFFPSVISALNGCSFVAVFMDSSIVLLESDFLFHSFFMICSAIGWSLE